MTAWIGIIGTVIGALVGGGLALLNARLQTRYQLQQERRKLILSKLEELHGDITRLKHEHRETFILLLYEQANKVEMNQQAMERRDLAADRIQMLVGFYAPELSKHIPKMMKETINYMDTLAAYVLAKRADKEQKEVSFDVLLSKREELESTSNRMQIELEDVSKKYI